MPSRSAAPALAAALLLLAQVFPASAQDDAGHHPAAPHPSLPEGWMAHFDGAEGDHAAHAAEGLAFEVMAPGWHVTTGPAGIFYQHDARAEGSYTLESEIFLFDPGTRRESFGVFLGGSELHDPAARSYTYFLVRRDGRYMIRQRSGEELTDVQSWTEHAAIPTWEGRDADAGTVRYRLSVEVGASEVVFRVNGEEVDRRPRAEIGVDGHYGLRVNHNLNLHVSQLETR